MPITELQRQRRRKHIGSSDVAAILNMDQFRNSADVWISKTHDPAVFFDPAVQQSERSCWTGLDKMDDPDLAAFATGAVSAFDLFIELVIAQYKAKAN